MATALPTGGDVGLGLRGPGENIDTHFVQSQEVQLIVRNKETLVGEIHPLALLPSLESVSREEYRKIVRVEREDGEQRAALALLDLLVSKPDFLPDLLQALRDVQQEGLARFLEQDLDLIRRENALKLKENAISKQGALPPVINYYINCNVQTGDHNQLHQNQLSSTSPPCDEEKTEYTVEEASPVTEPPPDPEQATPVVVPEIPTNHTPESETNMFNADTSNTTQDLIEEAAISLTPPESKALREYEEHQTEVRKLHMDDDSNASPKRDAPVEKLDTWGQNGDICTDGATSGGSVAVLDANTQHPVRAREEPVVIEETLTTADLKKDELYGYQKELVQLPKEGHNCIIFAPPKSGKTVMAAEVCRHHLARSVPNIPRDRNKPLKDAVKLNIELSKCKVLYMVPTLPVLEQVYKKLNGTLPLWKIGKKSSFSNTTTPLGELLEVYDVVVITSQILQNALCLAQGAVDISDITLLIFDECHHAKDDHPYNMVMHNYMKKKHETDNPVLPQILGLTATPGSGGNNTELSVQEHILNLCSNLDITRPDCFVEVQKPEHIEEIRKHSSSPVKESVEVCERGENPFTKEIHKMMATIEEIIGIPSESRQRGCQEYQSFIETAKQREGVENPCMRKSCEYLLHYNRGLEFAHTAQLKDGLQFITDQHKPLERRVNEGELDDTEMLLLGIYQSSLEFLSEVVRKEADYPNPFLQKLKSIIRREHEKEDTRNGTTRFRGIVFVKMKNTAQALKQWVLEDPDLTFLKPEVFLGKGNASEAGLTDSEQKEIISQFAEGKCNILFSTSVGEEGIHILDCNISVRYCHVRDEVSMTQAGGRARAQQSLSVVIADKNALQKEDLNVYRETLVKIVIDNLRFMPDTEFHRKINQYQQENLKRRQNKEKEQMERSASCVRFYCKGCDGLAFDMLRDVRKYESHYVNPDLDFKDRFKTRANRRGDLAKHGVSDRMYCNSCDQIWGGIVDNYPNPGLKNFLVEVDGGVKTTFSKWSKIPGASQIKQL